MAGRTYPAMEAENDRRPIPWSATMPNLEYTSTYSGAHSDITPASHHALSTAYDDLKKRYNDLQGKYTQTAKQLRDIQRRGSSPDLPAMNSSPARRLSPAARRMVQTGDMDDMPHNNGDLATSDLSLLSRERDLLERQVSELEHRLTEAGSQLADSEHETRQLREHVSHQEDDLRQNQRLLLRSESENEELRKRLTLIKRQMRSTEHDKAPGVAAASAAGAAAASGAGQGGSLNGSLDIPPIPGPPKAAGAGGGADSSAFTGELQSVLAHSTHLQDEMKDLKAVVQKQRDVIHMLIARLRGERENQKRRKEVKRQEPPTCGIGARPKVRNSANVPGGSSSLGAQSGRSQMVQPVPCTEDLVAPKDVKQSASLPRSSLEPPPLRPGHKDSSGVLRSPERVSHRAMARQRGGGQERFSAPAVMAEQNEASPAKAPVRSGQDNNLDTELESHYDDLQFGGGVSVTWERGTGEETTTEDLEPLLSSPRRLGRNESMEHLHDDSPPYDSVGDLNSTTSGSTLCGTDPEPEFEPRDSGYQPMGGSQTDLENRFRNTGSPLRQRSLNIERNTYRPQGSNPRSYDNTTQNVNLNTSGGEKFTATEAGEQPYLNNNPLVGHKTIPQRNLYPGTGANRGPSPEPTAPPRRSGRAPVEQASGEDSAPELRNCPVCNEDFPSHMAMDEFQQHVLECTGRTERICPMCDAGFPDEVLQSEFERHVNEHFEDDTTLQFEVLPS